MREDLHELIDGDLPDEQAAELLHLLSVDPEKRSLFRQQMLLQRDLYRNECFGRLSAVEEGEMFDRVSRSVGVNTTGSIGRLTKRGLLMLAVGFLVGSGAGYLGHGLVGKESLESRQQDTTHVAKASTAAEASFDRDSAIAAIRDSIATAMQDSLNNVGKSATRSPGTSGPASRRQISSHKGNSNDLTGRPEVRKQRRR